MRILTTLIMFAACIAQVKAQSEPVEKLLEERKEAVYAYNDRAFEARREGIDLTETEPIPPGFSATYLYPSTMRAANFKGDTLLTELSIQLEEAVFIQAERHSKEDVDGVFKRLGPELEEEGFEVWMEMSGSQRLLLMTKQDAEIIKHFVAVAMLDGNLIIVDYNGEMTLQQMMQLRNINPEDWMGAGGFGIFGGL